MTAPDLGAIARRYCSDVGSHRIGALFDKIVTTALAIAGRGLYLCTENRRPSEEMNTMSQTLRLGMETQTRRTAEALSQAVSSLRRIVLIRDGELVRRPRPRQGRPGFLAGLLRVTG
jgi:hypothetical protein